MSVDTVVGTCIRVSSILVYDSSNYESNVEAGYIVEGPDGLALSPPNCNTYHSDGIPDSKTYFFWATLSKNKSQRCNFDAGSPLSAGDIRVSIRDPDESGTWNTYLDGVLESGQGWATPWVAGDPFTNGERHSTGDPGNEVFNDLNYEDQSGFAPWSQGELYVDCDGSYDSTFSNDLTAEVNHYYTTNGYVYRTGLCYQVLN